MLHIEIIKETLEAYEEISKNPYYQELKLNKEYQELLTIANRINNHRFRIVVLGEFGTGKSSILNALIGEELLPVGFLPTTKQLIKIEHSEKEYVRSKENPEMKLQLTPDNVKKLATSSSEEIEVVKRLPEEIKKFVFYDTPGVNDISELPENLIFKFLPSADIVLFVLDSTQALKKTELDFLSSIIQKKDIEKFFFILNKSDLVGDEIESVRKFVIDTLSDVLPVERKFLEDRVIPYSAKRSLEAIRVGKVDELSFTGHKLLIENIRNFIFNNRIKLLEDRVKGDVLQIINRSLTKINVMIDRIEGKDKEYEKQLQKLDTQIEKFKLQIEREINRFKRSFKEEIDDFKSGIEKSFTKIKKKVEEKIDESDLEDLSRHGYIDSLLKSLIEHEMNKNTERFIKNLSKVIRDFDDRIIEDLKEIYESSDVLEVPKIKGSNELDGLFKAAGIIGTPVIAINFLPSMLGGGMLASLIGAAAVVGMMMNPQVTVEIGKNAGVLAVKAGELTAKFMQWVSGQMSVAGEHISKHVKKEEYKRKILKYLEDVKKEILEEIDEISPDEFVDKYIQTKFPQKLELEKRKELLETERNETLSIMEEDLKNLVEMKKRLEGVINGI